MSSQSIGTVVLPPTPPQVSGTPSCDCTTPCPDPIGCERERRGNESTWIRDYRKPARWILANGVTL